MTTASITATVLPKREHRGAGPGTDVDALTAVPILGGHDSEGQKSGALFLWAHARYHQDYEWELHPHERVEIMTVVIEGHGFDHYDTAKKQWAHLETGEAQLMQAGRGLRHIERYPNGTRGFQIFFDPGQEIASQHDATYTDYHAKSFTTHSEGDALVTDFIGGKGPIEARTEGLTIRRVAVPADSRATLEMGPDRYTLAFVISGAAAINGANAVMDDAVRLNGADSMTVEAAEYTDLFVISVPANPPYEVQRFSVEDMIRRHQER
jgi:quercetin 2,3-dioxygenase